jgi:hypothetical protein
MTMQLAGTPSIKSVVAECVERAEAERLLEEGQLAMGPEIGGLLLGGRSRSAFCIRLQRLEIGDDLLNL